MNTAVVFLYSKIANNEVWLLEIKSHRKTFIELRTAIS